MSVIVPDGSMCDRHMGTDPTKCEGRVYTLDPATAEYMRTRPHPPPPPCAGCHLPMILLAEFEEQPPEQLS